MNNLYRDNHTGLVVSEDKIIKELKTLQSNSDEFNDHDINSFIGEYYTIIEE